MIRCEDKILDENQWEVASARLKSEGRRIVFAIGCFDLPQAGHVRFLESARALGDALVLGMLDDAAVRQMKGVDRPVLSLDQRRRVMAGMESVSLVAEIHDESFAKFLRLLRPQVIATRESSPDLISLAQECGSVVKVIPQSHGVTSDEIVRRIRAAGLKK